MSFKNYEHLDFLLYSAEIFNQLDKQVVEGLIGDICTLISTVISYKRLLFSSLSRQPPSLTVTRAASI